MSVPRTEFPPTRCSQPQRLRIREQPAPAVHDQARQQVGGQGIAPDKSTREPHDRLDQSPGQERHGGRLATPGRNGDELRQRRDGGATVTEDLLLGTLPVLAMFVPGTDTRLVHHLVPRLEHAPEHVAVAASRQHGTHVERFVETTQLEGETASHGQADAGADAERPRGERLGQSGWPRAGARRQVQALVAATEAAARLEESRALGGQRQRVDLAGAHADRRALVENRGDGLDPVLGDDGIVVHVSDDLRVTFPQRAVAREIEPRDGFTHITHAGQPLHQLLGRIARRRVVHDQHDSRLACLSQQRLQQPFELLGSVARAHGDRHGRCLQRLGGLQGSCAHAHSQRGRGRGASAGRPRRRNHCNAPTARPVTYATRDTSTTGSISRGSQTPTRTQQPTMNAVCASASSGLPRISSQGWRYSQAMRAALLEDFASTAVYAQR